MKKTRNVNATDRYMFRSSETTRQDFVTILASQVALHWVRNQTLLRNQTT